MLTREGLGANGDPPEVIAAREARRPDGRLEPDLAEELDRALGEAAGAGVDEKIWVAFDQERPHAVPAQEEGRRQARQPTADNEDRGRLVGAIHRW